MKEKFVVNKEKSGDNLTDPMDGDQRFQDETLKMSDEHWKKHNPDFYEMMMKHRKKHSGNDDGTDEKTT